MSVEVGPQRRRVIPDARLRGGGVSPRVRVAEMQRARLVSAATVVVDELGWTGTTVAHITARARVSRRTFYDLFENREECLSAVLQDIARRIEGEIGVAELQGVGWVARVRGGLFVVLSFFDREPVLARVCVVQALHGGPRVQAWREGILTRLAAVLDEGRDGGAAGECTVLTAEGLVGAAFAIVYARLSKKRGRESLTSLLGELMGLIVLPYRGPAVARSERQRCLPSPPKTSERSARYGKGASSSASSDPLRGIPMRLTYRTAQVLDGVASAPGASNRMVADHAGITDQGQVSKLLSRLQRLGLLTNTSSGHKGEPNAWLLTSTGMKVTESIRKP